MKLTGVIFGLSLTACVWAQSPVLPGPGLPVSAVAATMQTPVLTPGATTLSNTPSTSAGNFLPLTGFFTWGGVEANRQSIIGVPGSLSGMVVNVGTAITANQWTFALRKNGVVVLSCIIASGQQCTAAGTVTIAATDLLDWESCPGSISGSTCTAGGVPTTFTWYSFGSVFTGTNNGESFVAAGPGNNPSTTAVNWFGFPSSTMQATTNDAAVSALVADAGTLDNLTANSTVAPGAGTQWTVTLFKNGAATGVSCIIANPALSCNSVAQATNTPFTVAANDTISWQTCPGAVSGGVCTPGTAPPNSTFSVAARWVPTTNGHALAFATSNASNTPAFGGNSFSGVQGGFNNGGDSLPQNVAPVAMHIVSIVGQISAAPGGTASRAIALRENGVTVSGPTCSFGSAATVCTPGGASYAAAANSLYDWTWTVANSPATTTGAKVGAVVTVP